MRKVETPEQAPLTAVPVEREEVQVRALRAAAQESMRETLAVRPVERMLAPPRPRHALPARRPLRRVLEKAVNGDDSIHQPWADLFETLAIGLASGMTEPDALRYAGRKAPPKQQALFELAARQAAEGVPLHCVLARHVGVPPVIAPILEHGMFHGTLESASRRAAAVLKRFAQIDRKFAYSAISPDLVPVLGILALLPLAPFVIGLFTQSGWPFFAFCVAGTLTGVGLWTRRDRLALRQPRTLRKARRTLRNSRAGLQNRALAAARWSRTLFALVDAGVPISSALEASADAARNLHYATLLRSAAAQTRAGKTLHDSLAEAQLLPPRLLEMIQTVETAGDLTLLDRFADLMEDDAKMLAAQRFARLLIGARLLLAGLAVAMLALCLGATPEMAIQGGLAVFGVGMLITWLLFLAQARNDL